MKTFFAFSLSLIMLLLIRPRILPGQGLDDSDVVLLLPASTESEEAELLAEAGDWVTAREAEGYSISPVALHTVAAWYGQTGGYELSAEEIRLYLRAHYTDRADGGRYLQIFSRQEESAGADYPRIPRYELRTANDTVATDSPYGFTGQDTLDGEDGVVDIPDLDFSAPVFLVSRVPVTNRGDLEDGLGRALGYESAEFSRDLTLVAGMFAYEGDTAYLQSHNAGLVNNESTRVFDTALYSPDYICTNSSQRLYTYMAGPSFNGGVVYNISHGGRTSISACYSGSWFTNLASADVGSLAADRLTIFVSLACANDSGDDNLARTIFGHMGAAVISASREVDPIDDTYVMIGELTFLPNFFNEPNTLLQAVQATRYDYYAACSADPESEDSRKAFDNILAFNVYGDGLITLPFPSPSPTPSPTASLTATPSPPTPAPTQQPTVSPSPLAAPPTPPPAVGDFDGDGFSDPAIYRPSNGLWAVRSVTRVYYGSPEDLPVPADYSGNGTAEIAVYRESSGLWAIRGLTRVYFGKPGDLPVPADYSGDGTAGIAVFRETTGLWAVRSATRVYFGRSGDIPIPGHYDRGPGIQIGIFRPASGLWAILGMTRVYYGNRDDTPVPADYGGAGVWTPAIFHPTSGLWAARSVTRAYFGSASDQPVPGTYRGDGTDRIGIFRETSGLWAIRGTSRFYFGTSKDIPVTR
jgi:hypothetical protein